MDVAQTDDQIAVDELHTVKDEPNVPMNKCTNTQRKTQNETIVDDREIHVDVAAGSNNPDDDDPIYIISESSSDEDRPRTSQKKKQTRLISKTKYQKGEFDVEKVLKHRKVGKITVYKVKWLGYPHEDCTWEPTSNFNDFKPIEDYFLKQLEKKV